MVNANPLVSIVIPCYNGVNVIKSCISSIQSQSYANIEIIIVNDASTDGSERLLNNLQKHGSISLINNAVNIGAHESVNVGYRAAVGKYVTHLDVDDELPHDAIEKRVKGMLGNKYDFLLTAEEVRHNNKTQIVYPCQNSREVNAFLRGDKKNKGINTHAYLARRTAVHKLGGRPRVNHRHHADYAFVLNMITNVQWAASDDVTYIYKRADGVLSQNMKHEKWQDSLTELEERYAKLITTI